ncbi:MAG TPA: SRPBCC domain-containing protein [Steroidobacteraceae bacterium]|nr:SRPBCC domain-containing protein [Steroidobacteraceae bacterium]
MKVARYGTRGYACLAEIEAPPARVWRALIDPALVHIWSGAAAEIDARPGGLYRVSAGDRVREARIDVYEANRRLRLIYFAERGMPASASAIIDDFLLDTPKRAGRTCLRLLGSGIPETRGWDAFYKRVRIGWERGLARLKVALENPPRTRPRSVPPTEPPLPGYDF